MGYIHEAVQKVVESSVQQVKWVRSEFPEKKSETDCVEHFYLLKWIWGLS